MWNVNNKPQKTPMTFMKTNYKWTRTSRQQFTWHVMISVSGIDSASWVDFMVWISQREHDNIWELSFITNTNLLGCSNLLWMPEINIWNYDHNIKSQLQYKWGHFHHGVSQYLSPSCIVVVKSDLCRHWNFYLLYQQICKLHRNMCLVSACTSIIEMCNISCVINSCWED